MPLISDLAVLTEQQELVEEPMLIIEFLLLALAAALGRVGRGCAVPELSAVGVTMNGSAGAEASKSMMSFKKVEAVAFL